MQATGWSWRDLMDTPWDVVQRMQIYLSVKNARETGKNLTFPEGTQ